MAHPAAIAFRDGRLILLDQRRLPLHEEYLVCATAGQVAEAIRTLAVRGAPAIGVAAAYALALVAQDSVATNPAALRAELEDAGRMLILTRPTAVNLAWAVEHVLDVARQSSAATPKLLAAAVLAAAEQMRSDDIEINRAIGAHGATLLADGARVLTHCNAGALATAGFGTALGIVRAAVAAGKRIEVWADETRPLLQGARLTAWELHKDGIPVTVIADVMAAHVLRDKGINAEIVGADRIAANGDTANKIGTYGVAVLAREHNLPFYVAAPLSTIDLALESGAGIPIEERHPDEIAVHAGERLVPHGVAVYNPAFDVTPARLVTAIVTERGIARPPYAASLAALFS